MKEYKPGDYYEFYSNEKTIESKADKNGYQNQCFYKEDIKWKVLYRDEQIKKMLVIAEKPTEQKITLQGSIGYDNGIEELDRICREITGREEARSLTKEDIEKSKYWKDKDNTKSKIIFGEDDEYYNWLASRCVAYYSYSSYFSFRMFYVGSGYVNAGNLYRSSNGVLSYSYAVRPVIEVDI